ncbi:hypothetical protein WN944_025890 [Citrus x changshan-huyou]|uniref:DNA-directed RNA polymerase subunit n=1 Tax=Citrus x changshan-huyou TaxID=2935761 RepID=A0AAP0LRF8_9ROSI
MAQLGLHTVVSASLGEMFFEVELLRDVSVPAKSLDRNGLRVPQRYIVKRLLNGLINEKACKDHCYFLSVTNLKSIDREQGTVNESRVVFFPVTFLCRTFLPIKGEILHGVIYATYSFGVILRCGRVVL